MQKKIRLIQTTLYSTLLQVLTREHFLLPTAGIKTVLTLNADSTYQYSADYIDRKDGHDEASGIYKLLSHGVIEITRPSSGETSYYKVRDAHSLIMTDSIGNEPEGAMAKHYVLTKSKERQTSGYTQQLYFENKGVTGDAWL